MKRIIIGKNRLAFEDRQKVIERILQTLSGLPPNDTGSIMSEIVFDLKGGYNQANLEKLFDSQILRLKNRGVNDNLLDRLRAKRHRVISRASTLNITFDRIPFLPVITKQQISLKDLLPLVIHDKAGATRLEHLRLSDIADTPPAPYYIIDIEDGAWLQHIAPQEAEITVKQHRRSCLTYCEVVALSIHTDVLSNHWLMALGSRYSNGVEEQFPELHLCAGKPVLDCRCLKDPPAKLFGTPSCSLRF
jgi:hypothetical protein